MTTWMTHSERFRRLFSRLGDDLGLETCYVERIKSVDASRCRVLGSEVRSVGSIKLNKLKRDFLLLVRTVGLSAPLKLLTLHHYVPHITTSTSPIFAAHLNEEFSRLEDLKRRTSIWTLTKCSSSLAYQLLQARNANSPTCPVQVSYVISVDRQ